MTTNSKLHFVDTFHSVSITSCIDSDQQQQKTSLPDYCPHCFHSGAELLSHDSVLLWMLKLIMVLLWMILLVLLLCAEAENVTEVRGELGTNVTLTCSNQTSEIHWYMEIHSQFRACIGRSFSSAGSTYCSPGFETKFSILGNKLVIKSLTAEDCRLYFCGIKRDGSIQFVETFRLVSNVTLNITDPQIDCRLSQLIIICVSVAVVVFVILGAVCAVLCLKRKSRRIQKNNVSLHIYENTDTMRAAQNKVIQSQRAKAH
ncbi:uncharacterized protein LOC120746362 [Simochromis diagramma]|uniref:uncharacterized protein LOC120746362 n=1 Tax=Simochromis diagramma TaxID=43689 RepID=UPI001A7EB204|nr:uncharacterized protein LOC120746362 [Simochromis diagramma]